MAMWELIIKNNSGSLQEIEDLGIELSNGTQLTLSDQFTYDELAGSDDLRAKVASADLVVNDGVGDLTAANGVKHLTLEHIYDLETDYYSKSELNTGGGGGQIHWDNVTNAPSFGSVSWGTPVKARVTQIASGKPAGPTLDDMCVDTDDDHLYQYDGTSWIDIYTFPTTGAGRQVINLDSTSENIFEFDGSWNDGGAPDDQTAVMVDNDGDGKAAQYVYEVDVTSWLKIGDVDFAAHFDGGAGKHDAGEIDVEGTYTNIPTAPGDLETIIGTIDSQMGTALDKNDLDEAYDEGGAGSGRTITADAGPVKLDTASATSAPFEIVPKANMPTTGLADGQLAIKDGILCIYDSTRSKWLSVQRQFLVFGRKGKTRNQYLDFSAGGLPSNNSGYRMGRAATIVSLSGQLDATGTGVMNVRRNDVATNIASVTITSSLGASDLSLNIDLNSGDYLQAFESGAATVEDPMFVIEIAWRLT